MTIVRAATYNLHRGIGVDGRYDPCRIVNVVSRFDADILAFQEVSDRSPLKGIQDLHAAFDGLRGYQVVAAPNVMDGSERYGNALLSRYPVTRSANLDIGVDGFEKRGALVAELDIRGQPLVVVATHLGLRRRERIRQYEMLREAVSPFLKRDFTVVFMGDFNSWLADLRDLRSLGAGIGFCAPATFPAPVPLLALDRIWSVPDGIRRRLIPSSGGARWASDHRPLLAELSL